MLEKLKWKKFPVLNDGGVCLVDCMGDDAAIVEAARVSYGEGTRHISEDRTLIRYLMRHRHSTPFEMAELKFRVRVPMDCWRQWIRHRTANVNEYSTRYSEAIDSRQKTTNWRLQSKSNKQGSEWGELEWPEGYTVSEVAGGQFEITRPDGGKFLGINNTPEYYLFEREDDFHTTAQAVYEERRAFGVAREQARKDLPLSTYTEAIWKIDLHNLLHFLGLRMDSHAQQEIREYATVIGEQIVAPLFPLVWEAFQDYRLGGMFLTRLDREVIRFIRSGENNGNWDLLVKGIWQELTGEPADKRSRERDECIAKLERLGLIPTRV